MSRSGERGVGVDGDNSVRKVRRRFDASLNPTISRPIISKKCELGSGLTEIAGPGGSIPDRGSFRVSG